ncbi:monocarboxylate transporter 13-like isoform X1 [Stegodyphus dumicola]|uniref:monocarboxylate transporter 13-like isoform X1 n=2 Tax=Stegodyphus dumicola TaxID=202533 RepID=UPI0015A8B493|nr:monocarboxylate transporter 13-like isoform X1 [Stegodyphus dumicola]
MAELELPDRGRAWVIAFAACIINMILSGLSRIIGILYVAVIETYGVTRQEATIPFTVRNSIRSLSGPLVGVIGQRYGIRMVTFWGGVVASAGAALCCIAPNVTWLAVFWGGVHGLGFAFANTLFQVVVNQYFEKHRATASGIALSGACVSSLAFPIMIEAILDKFALSGGFLILGGVVMHVLPPSLLLKAPPWVENPQEYARQWELVNSTKSVGTMDTIGSTERENTVISTEIDNTVISTEKEKEDECIKKCEIRLVRSTSLSNCLVEEVEVCSAYRCNFQKETPSGLLCQMENFVRRRSEDGVICKLYKITESSDMDDRLFTQNGYVLREGSSSVYSISGDVLDRERERVELAELHSSATPSQEPIPAPKRISIAESFISIAKLYTNPVYVLISLSMLTYIIILIPILTVIVDYSKDKGIPETNGKYLINAMAIGDLIGRLCFGWVTDKKYVTIPAFMTLTLFLEGIFTALFPFAFELYTFMALLALYGITSGAILVLFPVLVLKYVEQEMQSIGMGCVGFLSGLVSFGIPSLIGHFRDYVGSYDGVFYLTGAISVVSGLLWLLEPVLAKMYYKNKEMEKQ